MVTHEEPERELIKRKLMLESYTENCLGLLPMSHIYGLIVGSHVGPYRGDGVIVLPKYDFKQLLQSIQDYTIASTEAQLLTQLTVAVRNKAVEAFNDIMRMQI